MTHLQRFTHCLSVNHVLLYVLHKAIKCDPPFQGLKLNDNDTVYVEDLGSRSYWGIYISMNIVCTSFDPPLRPISVIQFCEREKVLQFFDVGRPPRCTKLGKILYCIQKKLLYKITDLVIDFLSTMCFSQYQVDSWKFFAPQWLDLLFCCWMDNTLYLARWWVLSLC